MKIVHVSDIHFGRNDPRVMSAAREAIRKINPELIIASGDLTQRARRTQFEAAINWLHSLEVPECVIVPGNHDVPLDSPIERFISPLARFHRYTHACLPIIKDVQNVRIVGIATPRPIVPAPRFLTEGAISAAQRRTVKRAFDDSNAVLRIVVQHHPLVLRSTDYGTWATPLVGARRTLAAYADSRVDLVLFGHLHRYEVGLSPDPLQNPHDKMNRAMNHAMICVMAGTLSTRLRDQPPGFVVLDVDTNHADVEMHVIGHQFQTDRFEPASRETFRRSNSGWQRHN